MNKTPRQIRNDKAGERIAEAFRKRHFEAYYCATKEEAKACALSLIPEGDVVSWGGAMTAQEIGLMDAVKEAGYEVIDRDTARSKEERMEMARRSLTCDTFIAGANALVKDGRIVNIDGNGNRVAAITFGPTNVLILASIDKVMPDLDSAMARARYVAAPVNVQRFPDLQTPCIKTGECMDCLSDDSICNYFQIIRNCSPAGKIKLILIGESCGF